VISDFGQVVELLRHFDHSNYSELHESPFTGGLHQIEQPIFLDQPKPGHSGKREGNPEAFGSVEVSSN